MANEPPRVRPPPLAWMIAAMMISLMITPPPRSTNGKAGQMQAVEAKTGGEEKKEEKKEEEKGEREGGEQVGRNECDDVAG